MNTLQLVRRWKRRGLFAAAAAMLHGAGAVTRQRLSLDLGWKFYLGDKWPDSLRLDNAGTSSGPAAAAFDDSTWRDVRVPHDWAVELPFDASANRNHGYKALGASYPGNSIGWYRRSFVVPATDKDQRFWLSFDGIVCDATVWVNGWLIRRRESGCTPLREDISDLVDFGGANTVAVRVDATQAAGRYCEGAGIHRHVWLDKTAPLAIAPDGVFVHASFPRNVPEGPATVHFETTVLNQLRARTCAEVRWRILAPDGRTIAENNVAAPREISVECSARFHGETQVASPLLWSPESPRLYRLVTTVSAGGQLVDRVETTFGIRTAGFDAQTGFLLNGRRYEIHGTCNHQEHAGIGVALPDALQEFRVRKLKEFGCIAYRAAHHPPTPELLDACDRLGLLVMDECRVLGSDLENLRRWEAQIRSDRNHPSVVMWSISNEESDIHDTLQARRLAIAMQDLARSLDPTRAVTCVANEENAVRGTDSVIEARGWDHHLGPCVDLLDTCGFPKDSFYYYEACWTTRPVLHLASHWNWFGREGQEILVEALSNCAEVELFLNGVLLSRQTMPRYSKLCRRRVRYTPGVLSAKGYDASGTMVVETKVETTGPAVQVRVTPDRTAINADGDDVAVLTVAAIDAQGRVVPVAQNRVNFALEGAGRIIGVGNGDANCHEPDVFVDPQARWSRSLFNGLAQVIVQSSRNAGECKLTASADGLSSAIVTLKTRPCTPRLSLP